jgi:hypothetical protein
MAGPKLPPPGGSSGAIPRPSQQLARPGFSRSASLQARAPSASILPLLLGIGGVFAGMALLIPANASAGGSSIVSIGLIGYFLAGFATPLFWGWDAAAQRRGYINPNFQGKRGYSSILRVLALVGIAISVVHLFIVSTVAAEKISEWLFINGFVAV